MPDLDNMAKDVRGVWKQAVHAGIREPEKLGQSLAHVLSNCAVKLAGEGNLPLFQEKLVVLAGVPLAQREQAFRYMQFPISSNGKDVAAKAARSVGRRICAGQVAVSDIPQVLAREFLLVVSRSQFFDRLTEPDLFKIFGSPEVAKLHLSGARRELEAYIVKAASEFGASMFQNLQHVKKPDIPKLSTEEHLVQDIDVLGISGFNDDEVE